MGVTELLVGVPFPALAFEIMRFAVPRLHLPEFTFGGATYDVAAAATSGAGGCPSNSARAGVVNERCSTSMCAARRAGRRSAPAVRSA